jgi:hypothetical protein
MVDHFDDMFDFIPGLSQNPAFKEDDTEDDTASCFTACRSAACVGVVCSKIRGFAK